MLAAPRERVSSGADPARFATPRRAPRGGGSLCGHYGRLGSPPPGAAAEGVAKGTRTAQELPAHRGSAPASGQPLPRRCSLRREALQAPRGLTARRRGGRVGGRAPALGAPARVQVAQPAGPARGLAARVA